MYQIYSLIVFTIILMQLFFINFLFKLQSIYLIMKRQILNELTVKTHQLNRDALFSRDSSNHHRGEIHSPYTPSHNKLLFMTAPNTTLKQDHYGKLLETHRQLNQLVQQLDVKVSDVIDKHETSFLEAYRNTMKKIKFELQELKLRHQKEVNGGTKERFLKLQKQLVLFREESYKLFQKIGEKEREIEIWKLKFEEAQSQKLFLQRQVKKLLKSAKTKEIQLLMPIKKKKPSILQEEEYSNNQKNDDVEKDNHKRSISYTPSQNVKTDISFLPSNFLQQLKQLLPEDEIRNQITNLTNKLIQQKEKKYQKLKIKYESSLKNVTARAKKTDLEMLFYDCVQSVKKQIYRKVDKKAIINYEQNIDLQVFKKQDHMKILEQFIQNKEVLKILHNAIFKSSNQNFTIQV